MENILDKEFLHNGTGEIYSELWQKPHLTTLPYVKPVGGFWTVPFNDSFFSIWLEYLQENDMQAFYDVINKKNVLVKLKSNTKLLTITSEEDLDKLRKMNLTIKIDEPIVKEVNNYSYTITEIPDYEKIFELYDAIYINPWTKSTSTLLKPYSVATMLILNQDVIDYYRTVTLEYNADYDMLNVKEISEKKTIKKPNKKYYELINIIKEELIPLLKKLDGIDKENLLSLIEEIKKKYVNSSDFDKYFDNNLRKTYVIINIIDNIITDYKKSLHSIKKWFYNDYKL